MHALISSQCDSSSLLETTELLLRKHQMRKGGLTELEKLTLDSVAQGKTYRQASEQYAYTESSFQNAASRLFREISIATGQTVRRRNLVNTLEQQDLELRIQGGFRENTFKESSSQFWLRNGRAAIITITYKADGILDINDYLTEFSQHFTAVHCLSIVAETNPLQFLWMLCNHLDIPLPKMHNNVSEIIKSIVAALKARKTLMIVRFDHPGGDPSSSMGVSQQELRSNLKAYAAAITEIGIARTKSCFLILDNSSIQPYAANPELVTYHIRQELSGSDNLRVISLNNSMPDTWKLLQSQFRA